MSDLNEEFFIGDPRNAPEKNEKNSSYFPSKFKCVVCDLETTSLINLHHHQTTQHKLEELSLSIIAMQSYIYHKEYLEPIQPTSGSKNKCRFYPFCSQLLSVGDENMKGNWKALVNSKDEQSSDNDDIQFITSLENPTIPAYKLTPISSSPALRKPRTISADDTTQLPPIRPPRSSSASNTLVPSNSPNERQKLRESTSNNLPGIKSSSEILTSMNKSKHLDKIQTQSKPIVKRLGTNAVKPLRRPNIGATDKSKTSTVSTPSKVATPEKDTSTSPAIAPAVPNAKPITYNREVRRPMWKPLKPVQPEEGEIVDMNLSD